MSQPQYSADLVQTMTNCELAQHLEEWAGARAIVSEMRVRLGKEPLDGMLLREAAARLRQIKDETA